MRNDYHKKKRGLLGAFVILFILLLAVGAGAWTAFNVLRTLPDPTRITERSVAESTKIYDRTGRVLLYEIHGEERRTVVSLSDVPERVKSTTIAAEDINFYKHIGLDWRGIIRATIKNFMEGDIRQGGSTITQQLVKNSFLTPEKTYSRKIKEALLAISLENKYSKNEILELYLNQIPYGSNAYGIEAASRIYFSKKPSELSLAEAATLASLLKAPTYYFSRQDELVQRRNWVLGRTAEAGFVSEKEGQSAQKEPLKFNLQNKSIVTPHFVLYVRGLLSERFGEDFVERGGLKVITTLDTELQKKAETAVRDGAKKNEGLVGAYNASLLAIDPRSGDILTMVGSRDYWDEPRPKNCSPGVNCKFDPQVNVAFRKRQPGSAFKPFVYATAFKKGYTPETVLFDLPTEFNPLCNYDGTPGSAVSEEKECYHPQNYDNKFRGPVTLRQALAQSLNVPSVKLLYLAGVEDSIGTARNMGITTLNDPNRYGLSLVLGGAEVTLFEMVSSFGAFAQEGVLHPPRAILRIENSKGGLLEEVQDKSLPVLDTEVARAINNILSDNEARVPVFSPRSSLYFPSRQVAAKTGTTQDFRDAWVVGYTPSIVAGVWVGNSDNSPFNQSGLSVMVAGPIWHQFLDSALSDQPPEELTPPEGALPSKPVLRGVYREGPLVKVDSISGKLATDSTPPDLIKEKSYGAIKTILQFIKKEDPLGDPPANPYQDPQYKNWQEAIDNWLKQNQTLNEEPPSQLDDIHSPQKSPQIELLNHNNQLPTDTIHLLNVKIQNYFPLKEVLFFIDDELTDSKNNLPATSSSVFTFKITTSLPLGVHKIQIIAYDEVGNKGTKEESLEILP